MKDYASYNYPLKGVEIMKKVLQFMLGFVFWTSLCWGEMASIAKDWVNVRSGPGTNYKVLWQVFENYPVKILEKKGDWAKTVDYENDIGWIHQSLLSKIHTVIVTGDKVNIRTGPGTQYEITFKAERGEIFHPVDREGEWLKIRCLDDYRWIHQNLVWGEY